MNLVSIQSAILAVVAATASAQPAAEPAQPAVAVENVKPSLPAEPPKDMPAPAVVPATSPAKTDVPAPAVVPATSPAKTDVPAAKTDVPDWEKGLTRITVLDGNLAVAVPVGDAAAAKAKLAAGKVPHVFSPYPAKALGPVPAGWKLGLDTTVPATLQRVTLADGRVLEIAVTAPVLQAADPQALATVLPNASGSIVQALGEARRSQAGSAASVRALIEALASRLPTPAPEATPPAR